MDNVKVYQMNDFDWVSSQWDITKTNEWYAKEFDENDIDDVEECDLDKDGMWWVTKEQSDVERLGDADALVSLDENGFCAPKEGDLQRRNGELEKWITFREAIQLNSGKEFPYIISTTEY